MFLNVLLGLDTRLLHTRNKFKSMGTLEIKLTESPRIQEAQNYKTNNS